MSYHSLRNPWLYERDYGSSLPTPDNDSDLVLCPRCTEPMDWDGEITRCLQCERRAKFNEITHEDNNGHN